MIQFLGLHLDGRRARAVALGRDVAVWAESDTPMVNAVETGAGQTVPPQEWARAGFYVLSETYLALPPRARKVWGLAVAAPSGWIALDHGYEPLSQLRLVPGDAVAGDVCRWRDENSRQAGHIATILAPKDYFRFAISGSLATDVTEVDRLGWLGTGQNEWLESALHAVGLERSQVPPVFDSHVPTGRLSSAGAREAGLPAGIWIVAGAHEENAGLITAADVRTRILWLLERPGKAPLAARGSAELDDPAPPEWSRTRSALAGYQVFERVLPQAASGRLAEPETTSPLIESLEASGHGVDDVVVTTANAAVGAAALAAVGSGLLKSWDRYYGALDAQAEEGGDGQ